MSAAQSHYDTFQRRNAQLVAIIERASTSFKALDMTIWVETADQLRRRVANERFRVMILGEFKRGKSTFINALLKAEVLPADVAPCTAVINEVKWGAKPRAILHFRYPPPEKASPLPALAKHHVENHRNGAVPPLVIPVEELQSFVRIPDPTANQAASIAFSPYDRLELFWPIDLCKSGVEIIDSPGLNEHHTRTKTTRDYLAYVDAVVFVMIVNALASESELAVIDNDLRSAGHDYLFFICNRFDELRRREDREKITNYAYAKLASRTRFGREGIFFISAADALDGRLTGNAGQVVRSGIVPLENALSRFLVEDRGRIKLLQPAANLSRGLRAALSEVVPGRRKLLEEDVGTLRRRLQEAQPLLDQAGRKRDTVLKQVEAARMRVRDAVRRETERFFSGLTQDVPLWVRKATTKSINPWTIWNRKAQTEEVAQEVVAYLGPAIQHSMETWEREELRPLIAQQMSELTDALNMSLEPFLEYLDSIKARLTGGLSPTAEVQAPEALPMDRILAGAGGALVGAGLVMASTLHLGTLIGTAGLAAATGVVGAKVGAVLMSMANPLLLGPMIVGAIALHKHQKTAMTEKVKLLVASAVAENLRQEAGKRSAEIADEVYGQTAPIIAQIAEALDRELQQVREQVDAIIAEKEKGEEEVQRQQEMLTRHEALLRSVAEELNEFMLSLSQKS